MYTSSHRSLTNRVFIAVVTLWVGVGVQPCAIAAMSDLDCPHAEHHAPNLDAATDDHCGGASPDPIVESDCCDGGEPTASQRVSTIEIDPDSQPLAFADFDLSDAQRRPFAQPVGDRPPDPGFTPRPRHKLFCVYRD